MRTVLIEYTPLEAKDKNPLDVFNYVKKCVRENQATIQTSRHGRRINVMLQNTRVAVIEVRR